MCFTNVRCVSNLSPSTRCVLREYDAYMSTEHDVHMSIEIRSESDVCCVNVMWIQKSGVNPMCAVWNWCEHELGVKPTEKVSSTMIAKPLQTWLQNYCKLRAVDKPAEKPESELNHDCKIKAVEKPQNNILQMMCEWSACVNGARTNRKSNTDVRTNVDVRTNEHWCAYEWMHNTDVRINIDVCINEHWCAYKYWCACKMRI